MMIAALHDVQQNRLELHSHRCQDLARKQRDGWDLLVVTTDHDDLIEHAIEASDPDDLGYRESVTVRRMPCADHHQEDTDHDR